jgi:biofilm PGA synthesis N-glycosyltransferase PgaC
VSTVFWLGCGLVVWAYLGYPALVLLLAHCRGRAPATGEATPMVTVVIAARNEADRIGPRVDNVLACDYAPDRLRIVVVSDGSTDDTADAATRADPRVVVLRRPLSTGKAAALTAALPHVRGDVVVFTDARQRFTRETLRHLVAPFADPRVGAVSGELMIGSGADDEPVAARMGLYWRYEKAIREAEGRLGLAHGATGAVYAVRREHFQAMPPGTILDDMYTPLNAVRSGQRIWVERRAIAWDVSAPRVRDEFSRKLRTLAGNWQLLGLMPWLLIPWRNPVFGAWASHKLLRLLVPWALLAMLMGSAAAGTPFYAYAFAAQAVFYLVGAAAALTPSPRMARLPGFTVAGTFVVLNAAALLALPAYKLGDASRLWRARKSAPRQVAVDSAEAEPRLPRRP